MAVLSATNLTLLDWARRVDPNGKIAKVAEVLNKYNEILDDMVWKEGNLPTGHKTTLRGSVPAGTWRLLNQGIVPQKSTTKQITETCGMLENYSEVDKDLAMLNGNTDDFRFSEDLAIIEGMNQSLATAIFYGDTSVNPEQFVGLLPRYYGLSTAVTSANVIDGKGTTAANNTSIYLIGWGDDTVHGIFPNGSKAGLQVQDLGEQTIYDAALGRFQALRTHFQFKAGICVRDWRYVVRIANIDITNLETATDGTDTSANILKYMSQALDKLPPNGNCKPVFYMNQRVRAMLRAKLISKSNLYLTLENMMGGSGITRPTLGFQGYPCRRVDAILNTEAVVT